MLFYPDSDSNRKFSVPWLKTDKKTENQDKKAILSREWRNNQKTSFFLDPDKKAKLTS